MSKFITHKQFASALFTIERANCKVHGKSLSASSMRASDLIIEIQDDRGGMLVVDNWREQLKARFLEPVLPTPTEVAALLQETLQEAFRRACKYRREMQVFRFETKKGVMRYRIFPYPSGEWMKAMKDGETVIYLGKAPSNKAFWGSSDPLPFWCESHFKDEYKSLPLVQEYERSFAPTISLETVR